MMICDEVRERIALEPTTMDAALAGHLAGCAGCAAYQRTQSALEGVLRAELRWEPPPALTAQLLAIAALPAAALAAARPVPLRPRPKEWYVKLVYLLTLAVIGVSVAVAWQVAGMLSAQMGLSGALAELAAAPGRTLAQLTTQLPEARTALEVLQRARDLIMWLLMVAILWRLGEQYGAGRMGQQAS
ncbi:MAG TPA: anti-sigma factor [Roseiflexaceae bacterium]|nr:anti-sigma factor [Roseiflexaceae bacterium]